MKKLEDIKSSKEFIKFITGVDLVDIYIKSSDTNIEKKDIAKKDNLVTLKENYEIIENKKNSFQVLCRFSLHVINGKKIPIKINVSYNLIYKTQKKIKKIFFKPLIDSHVKFTVAPYFREFVGNTSLRMSVSPIILPEFKLISKALKEEIKIKKRK